MAENSRIIVRKAVKEDMADVILMIQELADFEEMSDRPKLTVEDLIQDGGFNSNDSTNVKEPPLFFCFICTTTNRNDGNVDFILNRHSMTRKSIGYSMCFYSSYSTWGGRTLYMQDLYVKPSYRKLGIGKMLLQEIARFALETGCVRIDFQSLKWNPAVQFYKKLGAVNLTETKDLYRDGGFISSSDPIIFVCFIAEVINDSFNERKPVGYAIVFNGYSTWQGRSLKLKDLYVKDGYRKLSAGRKLIQAITAHAKEVNAAKLYLHVLECNTSARQFYESLGAKNWTESDEFALFRFDKNAIKNLAQ